MVWRALPDPTRRAWAVYPALAVVAGLLTAGIEGAWYGLASGADPVRVLEANLSIDFGLRPGHWVFLVGLVTAGVIALVRLVPSRRDVGVSASRPSGPTRARTAHGS
jgi:sulfoxide reductase heme-binding subunit YedZ